MTHEEERRARWADGAPKPKAGTDLWFTATLLLPLGVVIPVVAEFVQAIA